MEVTPGYKATEIGTIPEEWEVKAFGELFSFKNGVNADKAAYGKGVPFINVLEPITFSHLSGAEIPGRVTLSESLIASYGVKRGDVLFNRTSETESELALAAAFVGTERVVFGGFVIRGRPADNSFDPLYSGYAFRARAIREQIIPMGQGAVRANIGQRALSRVITPVPPIAEQHLIADALSDVDKLLSGLERIIAKKRNLRLGMMQRLLTGQTRLSGFQREWRKRRLAELLTYERPDNFFVRSVGYEEVGQTPVLTANKSFILGYTNEENGVYEDIPVIIFDDFTTDNKYVDFPFKVKSSAIKILKARSADVNLKFLFDRMQLVRFPLGEHKRHYISEYRELELAVPERDEQEAIAHVIGDVDTELGALEQRRQKTCALKQGMMQALLTGKTRLV